MKKAEAVTIERVDVVPVVSRTLFSAAAENDVVALNAELKHSPVNLVDEFGMSALHHAASGLAKEAIDCLLRAGADPLIVDNYGRDAAWVAIEVWGNEGLDVADLLRARAFEQQRPSQEL